MVEKEGLKDLGTYRSKSYSSVVLSVPDVTSLEELKEEAAFGAFFLFYCFINSVAK